VRYEFLAAVAAVRELVVRDASFAVDVWVERLAGVSVYCEEFERLAEEGFLCCFGMKLRMTLSEGGRLLSEGGKLYLGFFARRVCSCMWMSDDHARDVDETQWPVCDDDM
jgi:hypothetical protein